MVVVQLIQSTLKHIFLHIPASKCHQTKTLDMAHHYVGMLYIGNYVFFCNLVELIFQECDVIVVVRHLHHNALLKIFFFFDNTISGGN